MKKIVIDLDKIDNKIVFIIAFPRSGTNWLQRMIVSSSSKVVTGPESYLMRNYIVPQIKNWERDIVLKSGLSLYFTKNDFFKKLKNHTADFFETIAGKLKHKQFYLDKTSSNALVIEEIKRLFPNSKVIHVIRDPRDAIASLHHARKTWAIENDDPDTNDYYIDLWKKSVTNARKIKDSSSSDKFIEVRYENLLKNTFDELKKILYFLNIKTTDKKIKKIIKEHSFKNISKGKGYKLVVKGEIGGKKGKIWNEPKGFFRKGKIGSWQEDLTFIQKVEIWFKIKKLMTIYGYKW